MVLQQRCDGEDATSLGSGATLLVAEVLLPDRGGAPLPLARDAVLDVLTSELPVLERHLVLVDSVHDGLPVWVYEQGKRRAVDRTLVGQRLR